MECASALYFIRRDTKSNVKNYPAIYIARTTELNRLGLSIPRVYSHARAIQTSIYHHNVYRWAEEKGSSV